MTTQKIQTKNNKTQKSKKPASPKRRWISIIVLSAIVLVSAIILLIAMSGILSSAKVLLAQANDIVQGTIGDHDPTEQIMNLLTQTLTSDILPKAILFVIFLLALIGVGIAAFVQNLKTGIKSETFSAIKPDLITKLFCIISAALCLIIFGTMMGLMASKIMSAVNFVSPMIEQFNSIETLDAAKAWFNELNNGLQPYINSVNTHSNILFIVLIVLGAGQTGYAIANIVLKKGK